MSKTIEEQIKCVGREIGMRKSVYPRFVASGKFTQERSDNELETMQAVYETLKRLQNAQEESK